MRYMTCFSLLTIMAISADIAVAKDNSEFFQPPIELEARKVLPANMLQGANYVVDNKVQNDGLINVYQIKTTTYGTSMVEGTLALRERINELNAIGIIGKMDKSKIAGDSLVAGTKAPVKVVAALVDKPAETSKGIIKGAGKFFSNIGRSIVSEDPYQDNALEVALGYDATKRAYAFELKVNPYTSYEPLAAKLSEISQASVAGGFVPRAVMAVVGGPVGTAVNLAGTSESMRQLVRDNSVGELRKINAAKLAEIGTPRALIVAFLDNLAYNPQETTLLVGALEMMKDVQGREHFIAAAALATNARAAMFHRQLAQLMAAYAASQKEVKSMGRLAGTPYLKKKDTTAVMVLPLDYVFRTAEVQAKLDKIDAAVKKEGDIRTKELWLTGKVDESMKMVLTKSGWKVVENAEEYLNKK